MPFDGKNRWDGIATKVAGGSATFQTIAWTVQVNAKLLIGEIVPSCMYLATGTGAVTPVDMMQFSLSVDSGQLLPGMPCSFVSGDSNSPVFSFNSGAWYIAGYNSGIALPMQFIIQPNAQLTIQLMAFKTMALNDSILFSIGFAWETVF